jgi:transposase
LQHPTITVGSACPYCAESHTVGRIGIEDDPQVLVRLVGQPLISGTQFIAPIYRCGTCDKRFYTPIPDEIKNTAKHDVTVGTSLAIARYDLGLPMSRIEKNQAMQGIPMSDSTQYDIIDGVYDVASYVFNALITKASNGDSAVYDDTPGRILENKAKGIATHTTAIISVVDGHKVHLFMTGSNTAGKNVDEILAQRTSEKPLIAMMDASPNNLPKRLKKFVLENFILCYCLTHGRRKFFEVFGFFDKPCDLVLDIIGQVYAHDDYCKKNSLSKAERLAYHQQYSAPLMATLYIWLNNQLVYDQTEPNGGLGKSITYMLKHWIPLTAFLRVEGAPLDSSWAERAIKIAIRHRRNSLFYKTNKGAKVGDCLMSLIYTAKENNVNPYDYLNTLQRYADEIKANPSQWFVWNYTQTVAAIVQKKAA